MKITPHQNQQLTEAEKLESEELQTIREKLGSLSKEDVVRYIWKLKNRVEDLETKVEKIEAYLKSTQ